MLITLFISFLLIFPTMAMDVLTKADAHERAKIVRDVRYKLFFEFTKESPEIKAQAKISFNVLKEGLKGPLRIDLNTKTLLSVSLNGKLLDPLEKGVGYFLLPVALLKSENTLDVSYVTGPKIKHIRRHYDEADKSQYFYTSLQADGAHYLYPGFDQPDIRGVFEVTMKVPAEWTAISNEAVVSKKTQSNFTTWEFGKTQPLSPYLVFLGAGDYVRFDDKWGEIPMALYVRKSLAGNLDKEQIFSDTKRGLEFYQEYFDKPYPFSKYDQIFVPDSANAGMENPGAVTLTERFIPMSKPTKIFISARNSLIFHEIVHMWFGNLVAMKWWDDLWLNESFATYFASYGLEKVFQDQSSWVSDLTNRGSAYVEDISKESSHPIIADVPDNTSADGAFDSIAYSKGAAFVNQLHFVIGETVFRQGVRNYFKKYAGKNTTKDDFINSIDEVTQLDIASVSKAWLESSGPNEVTFKIDCDKDHLKKIEILQEPNFSGGFIPALVSIVLYRKNHNKLEKISNETVRLREAVTVLNLKKHTCPDFIQPDVGSHHYAKFILDAKSLENAALAVTSFSSDLDRFQLWRNLDDSLKSGTLKPGTYLRIMAQAILSERSPSILACASGWLDRRAVPFKDSFEMYFTKGQKDKFAKLVEAPLQAKLNDPKENPELKKEILRMLTFVGKSPELQSLLFNFVTKKANLPVELDYETKWMTIHGLSRMKHPEIPLILEQERKTDPSLETWKNVMQAMALYPDPKMKEKVWPMLLEKPSIPYYVARFGSENIHSGEYPELSSPYLEPFFTKISQMDWSKAVPLLDFNFYRLFPVQTCSPEALALSKRYLENSKNLYHLARRKWHRAQGELEQCVSVRHAPRKP